MEFLRKETQGIFQRKVFSVICNVISIGLPRWLGGKEFPCNAGDVSSIPDLGRFLGEGNGNPFQYPCLGNAVDRVDGEAWRMQSMGLQRVS